MATRLPVLMLVASLLLVAPLCALAQSLPPPPPPPPTMPPRDKGMDLDTAKGIGAAAAIVFMGAVLFAFFYCFKLRWRHWTRNTTPPLSDAERAAAVFDGKDTFEDNEAVFGIANKFCNDLHPCDPSKLEELLALGRSVAWIASEGGSFDEGPDVYKLTWRSEPVEGRRKGKSAAAARQLSVTFVANASKPKDFKLVADAGTGKFGGAFDGIEVRGAIRWLDAAPKAKSEAQPVLHLTMTTTYSRKDGRADLKQRSPFCERHRLYLDPSANPGDEGSHSSASGRSSSA